MKGKVIVIILLMFSCVGVFAVDDTKSTEQLSALKGGLDEGVENVFEREIIFPESIQPVTRLLFGEKITIARLIVLVGIWVAIFAMIRATMGFVPFFEGAKVELGVSVIVTVLVIMTGVVDDLSAIYFDFLDTLKWLEGLGPLKIFLGLAFVGAIAYGVNKITEIFKEKRLLDEADIVGESIATASSMGKIAQKNM